MPPLVSFTFQDMEIRGLEIDQDPWFVAKDIATALGYANTRKAIADHCKYARPAEAYPIEGVADRDSLDPQTVIIPEAEPPRHDDTKVLAYRQTGFASSGGSARRVNPIGMGRGAGGFSPGLADFRQVVGEFSPGHRVAGRGGSGAATKKPYTSMA